MLLLQEQLGFLRERLEGGGGGEGKTSRWLTYRLHGSKADVPLK